MSDVPHPQQDPEARLEQALIDEFLRARGHDSSSVASLPVEARHQILQEASIYAAGRLTEIEARARFVHDLHRKE